MICERIVHLRTSAGMSQLQLAHKIGVSGSAVGMYEQGRREPCADTLAAIAKVFDVSLDYLITGEEYGENINTSKVNPMSAQEGLDRLIEHFLGIGWKENHTDLDEETVNTIAVNKIIRRHIGKL